MPKQRVGESTTPRLDVSARSRAPHVCSAPFSLSLASELISSSRRSSQLLCAYMQRERERVSSWLVVVVVVCGEHFHRGRDHPRVEREVVGPTGACLLHMLSLSTPSSSGVHERARALVSCIYRLCVLCAVSVYNTVSVRDKCCAVVPRVRRSSDQSHPDACTGIRFLSSSIYCIYTYI